MLYNQDWEKPKRDIHSLDSLIDWLQTKPRFGRYTYYDTSNCLLAQYMTAMGRKRVGMGSENYSWFENGEWQHADLPAGWNNIALASFASFFATYGFALRRAKKLRAKHNTSLQGLRPQDRPVASSESLGNIA